MYTIPERELPVIEVERNQTACYDSCMTRYANAPITEAIIDLRVKLAPAVDVTVLESVCDALKGEYPAREAMFAAEGELEVGPAGGKASIRQEQIGWKLTSDDKRRIVQFRREGCAFSQLAPYETWETFRDEAKRVWSVFREILKPLEVLRLAVRYINRVDIPSGVVELKDYFRTYPEVAPELPQELEGFFVQLMIPFHEQSARCILNQAIVPPSGPGFTSLALDIDLFRSERVPQTESDIWVCFERLRIEKDRIFEACITNTTRRFFQ